MSRGEWRSVDLDSMGRFLAAVEARVKETGRKLTRKEWRNLAKEYLVLGAPP